MGKRAYNSRVDLIINNHPLSFEIERAERLIVAIDFVTVVVSLTGAVTGVVKDKRVASCTSLYQPIQCHPHVLLVRDTIRIGFFLGEHENGIRGEFELVDEKVTHALSVVDASLKLVARETVRDTADHSSLPAVRVRELTERRGDLRRRLMRDGGGRRLRRSRAGIGDVSYSLAESAAYGSGAGWELERGPATGAIDEHRRRVHG